MTTNTSKAGKWKELAVVVVVVAGLLAGIRIMERKVESSSPDIGRDAAAQITFQSPTEAAAALAQAAKTGDESTLVEVLGGETKALLTTGDTESDKAAMASFAAKYQQMNRWVDMTDGSRVLYIGADNFAFPVPLAKNSSGNWYFDAVAGAQEIRAREIGRNELLAIDASLALSAAQQIYFDNADSPEYAQRIISTAGKQDGLYWPAAETQVSSPAGNLSKFPKASLVSFSPEQPFVIDGYSYRILTAQGEDAKGGARSYIVNGKMIGGFAILATPVKYAETGIMTFTISREGMVYEQNLGPDTVKIAGAIQQYNPDETWSAVE